MKELVKRIARTLLWSAVYRRVILERPDIIALTGSVGKTSTKEAIAAVLKMSGRPVIKTLGNMNTEFGVPMSLLGYAKAPTGMARLGLILKCLLPPVPATGRHPYYVLEYSADKQGDIPYLAKRLSLSQAVLTRIVPVHMQAYPKFEDLVNEKSAILTGLRKDGVAILNHDDPVQKALADNLSSVLWYGIVTKPIRKTGVWAHGLELGKTGWAFHLQIVRQNGMDSIGVNRTQSVRVQSRLLGKHQLYALVAAAAVGVQEHIPLEKIATALEAYELPPGRGRVIEGRQDMMILDDTYNASPEAVKDGLDMLSSIERPSKRRVAILGNMNELGDATEQAHLDVARYSVGKADYLVFVGPNSEKMVKEALQAGQVTHHVMGFRTPEQLIDKIDQVVKRGDIIYIKGSQNGVRLERVVKKLMAHPDQAATQLVRQ